MSSTPALKEASLVFRSPRRVRRNSGMLRRLRSSSRDVCGTLANATALRLRLRFPRRDSSYPGEARS